MQLVVQSGAEPGRTYDITASQKIRMGRQSGNDVVVPDEQVSRRHAEIEERNGGLVVTDLGSSNGTFVNGTRIASPQSLQPGDTVQVGTTVLKVLGAASAGGAGDFDQGGATQVSFTPSGQDSPYSGGYGSSAAPSSPAQPDYGQAAPAYGQPQSYDPAPKYQQGAYDQQQQPAAYDQGAGGYGQQPATYDQGGQPQVQSAYEPQSYNQGQGAYGQQAGAYDPAQAQGAVYGQQQAAYDPQAAYNQGQGAYGGQAAPNAYGQPAPVYPAQGVYGQPPAPVVAVKRGLPLPLILLGAVIALLVIGLLVFFLVINKGGGTAIGSDIPEPKNSTKLDVSAQDIAKLNPQASVADISKISYGFYASNDTPAQVGSFYRTEMKNRGWTEDTANSDATSVLFKKGDNSAAVASLQLNSQAEVDAFTTSIPTLKDKIKAGQTLVILASGQSSLFTTTPTPAK